MLLHSPTLVLALALCGAAVDAARSHPKRGSGVLFTPKSPSVVKVTSSSSSPHAVFTASAASLSVTPNKKGISYNTAAYVHLLGNNISWTYNWGQTPGGTIQNGVAYVPMMWGANKPDLVRTWNASVQAAIKAGATHLLGFNEPDLQGQAEMTVQQCVDGWRTYMQPWAGKLKLVSPAVTNGGAPMGVTFLKNFLNQCTGCTVDAVAMHWYDSATNLGYFTGYLSDAIKTFSPRKIWLTEFRGSGTAAQQVTFINSVVPWMNNQTGIERYALFGLFEGAADKGLMVTNGALNSVGQAYLKAH
ncbi:hypothetical protein EMMF5_004781 [Cystobasidiomycetes sp. EMM_F5]